MNEKQAQCKSCSKEIQDKVPIIRVIEKLDSFFSKNDLDSALRLLNYWEKEAKNLGDTKGLLEILNEEIGIYRRLNDKERGLKSAEAAIEIIEQEGYEGTVSAGTIYINAATTMKAFGLAEQALPYYKKAEEIYEKLGASSYKTAALFNNMASAYAELGERENAEKSYLKAIELLSQSNDSDGEIAVSFVNLAHLYNDANEEDERIGQSMEKAWEYLQSENIVRDGSYAFICSKCAPAFGYFGYFLRKKQLEEEAEKIYGRN